MGCFMACFGLSNKRKRRKTLYKVLAGNQNFGNYEALAITEKSIVSYSDFRKKEECKEKNGIKSKKKKKKVTFNMNVQIYEPNPTAYQVLDNEEDENENITMAEPVGRRISPSSILEEGSAALTKTYPPNYRYYNCSDEYDEEEEIAYEESDIDDYDDDDDSDEFDDGYDCDDGGSDESIENDEAEAYDQNTRQKELSERIVNQTPLAQSGTVLKSNLSGRERIMNNNLHSVLIPVENLTQWKAIKAKVASRKHRRRNKENVPSEEKTSILLASEASLSFSSPCSLESSVLQSKPLLPEIAVDASLSNWLISPNYNASMTKIHCQ